MTYPPPALHVTAAAVPPETKAAHSNLCVGEPVVKGQGTEEADGKRLFLALHV